MPDSAPLPLRSWLRRLVVVEIVLSVILLFVGFFETHFLPPFLAGYAAEAEPEPPLIAVIALTSGLLVLLAAGIFSWVALLRGWRSGRRLYTMVSIAGFAFLFLDLGPMIASAPGNILDTLLALNSGLIFSLLYFTDLRHFYSRHDATQPA